MNKHIPIFISLLILAFATWIQLTTFAPIRSTLGRFENISYDLQLRTKVFTQAPITNSPVVIVDIDDDSLSKEGRWPWSRSKLADLVQHLKADGAVVLAFDILFAEKEDNIVSSMLDKLEKQSLKTIELDSLLKKIEPLFDEDKKLADSLKDIDVTLGITFIPRNSTQGTISPPLLTLRTPTEKHLGFVSMPGYISNIKELQLTAKNSAFINVFPDPDGVIRRVPLFIRYQDGLYPSLALDAVHLFLFAPVNWVTGKYNDSTRLEGIQVGDHLIPTDTNAQAMIPFVGPSYTLPFFSATQILHDKIPTNALQGKIVFVGSSATGLGDIHATAIQSVYPGIEVQASIAYGILTNSFSFRPEWALGAEVFLTLTLGLLWVFILPYFGPRMLGVLIIFIPAMLIFINNWVWNKTGLIIIILIPILLPIIIAIINILYGYLFETRRREQIKEMFGQYVPEKHIDQMLKTSGKNYGLLGEDREMTVLFADIRSFTTISEPLSATQLKDLLNAFFTPMTEIIFTHHGTIDKYVGDMIMAFWGAPLKDELHAQHAITAALEMQIAVKKLHAEFALRDWPEINIGIGLNTGIMSVGDMGSKFRRNYTVLGDAVNLASRAEGLTKFYGVNLIVTQNTQQGQKDFVFRQLDKVKVKGKKTGVAIYEAICKHEELTPTLKQELDLSQQALDYYFLQQWQQAEEIFIQLSMLHPETKLYTLYLNRITNFKLNSPPAEWDGVFIHTSK